MHVDLVTAHEAQQTQLLQQPLDADQRQAAHAATDVGSDDYQSPPMKLHDLFIVLGLMVVCWAVVVGAGLTAWNVLMGLLASLGWVA
jgi:hypothetical protein